MSKKDSSNTLNLTAEEAYKIANPTYKCTLTDDEILHKMEKRIRNNSMLRKCFASFPNVWFRDDVIKVLLQKGYRISETTYDLFWRDIKSVYRRVSWDYEENIDEGCRSLDEIRDVSSK